jgi:hypothetical protein
MKKLLIVAMLGILEVLVGCATGYQQVGWNGGYSETLVQNDTFIIDFDGNEFTSPARARDFALLRAADFALEKGYAYFQILEKEDAWKYQDTYHPEQVETEYYQDHKGRKRSRTKYSPGYTSTTSKPSTSITVKCYKANVNGAFAAREISDSMRKKYNIK